MQKPQHTLEQKLDTLVQIVLRARTFFDFWWIYENVPTRKKYLPAMNRYSEFFKFDSHAQEVAYTIYLCQVFDKRKNTLSVVNVIEEAKARNISKESIATAEEALHEAEPILKKMSIIRNNLFAHRKDSLSFEDAFKKASIKPNQIRSLTELALDAVNSLRTSLGQESFDFSEFPGRDLSQLLEEITKD